MQKPVQLSMKTVYGKNTGFEHEVAFFTEGIMESYKDSYIYTYDESNLYDEEGVVTGQLEVGKDYLVRTIQKGESYVLHFKKGTVDRGFYFINDGFVAEVETLDLDVNMKDGLGSLSMLYNVYFENDEKILTEYLLDIKESQ